MLMFNEDNVGVSIKVPADWLIVLLHNYKHEKNTNVDILILMLILNYVRKSSLAYKLLLCLCLRH